jgi:hypothetical protein
MYKKLKILTKIMAINNTSNIIIDISAIIIKRSFLPAATQYHLFIKKSKFYNSLYFNMLKRSQLQQLLTFAATHVQFSATATHFQQFFSPIKSFNYLIIITYKKIFHRFSATATHFHPNFYSLSTL